MRPARSAHPSCDDYWNGASGVGRVRETDGPALPDGAQARPFEFDPRRGFRQIGFFSLKGVQFNRQTPHHTVAAYLRLVDALFILLRPNF